MTIKTFHALCLQVISEESDPLGPRLPICILNEADRRDVVKTAIGHKGGKVSASEGDPDRILRLISLTKQRMLSPEDDLSGPVPEAFLSQFPAQYKAYQQLLLTNHLLDFDDLLFKTVRLFETHEAIREKYEKRFPFISVDEYQDINYAQYRLIRLLAPPSHDICVIGDPDQAIYGFRGADVQYFHRFCQDYPKAKKICLNQNYRSTETILRASGQVIGLGDDREEKTGIWSGIYGARALTVAHLATEKAEAEYVVKTIDQEVGGISHFSLDSGRTDSVDEKRQWSFSDFAVLYRVKGQAKALSEAMERSGIPFQMVGEEKLATRKGIRELISYLRVGLSMASGFDVERMINFPPRGIGRATMETLRRWSETTANPYLTAFHRAAEISGLTPNAKTRLLALSEDLNELTEQILGKEVY
jgi:DNA helicase-2/ATP-dependent DNA helicase PcrA